MAGEPGAGRAGGDVGADLGAGQQGAGARGDGGGGVTLEPIQTGSTVLQAQYDGLDRRIVKQVQNSVYLNATYHYYYDSGHSLLETRNGSDLVLTQYLWANLAGGYLDELVQIAHNGDPINDPRFDSADPEHAFRGYWAMPDANFNILGLVDSSGILTERYEYSPYGERTVFFSPGSNDPGLYAPTLLSRRIDLAGTLQPYGLNPIGHQGLLHDESTDLIYNRARQLHPRLGRFMQRDPLGYVDGMSLYQYVRANPTIHVDPHGTESIPQSGWTEATARARLQKTISTWRSEGWNYAANLLQHFLDKKGPEAYEPTDEDIAEVRRHAQGAIWVTIYTAVKGKAEGVHEVNLTKYIRLNYKARKDGSDFYNRPALFYAYGGVRMKIEGEATVVIDD